MNDVEQIQPTTDKTNKRRGSAFSTLAHVFRDVRELVFTTGFLMRNRPGLGKVGSAATGFIPVKNMFEAYYDESATGKVNGIIIGRMGDGEKRKTNLIELSANCDTTQKNLELGYNNGVVKLRVTRDGENPPVDRSGVTVYESQGLATGDQPEGVAVHVVGNGTNGGVIISHITDKSDNPNSGATGGRRIAIYNDGIYFYGLPTASTGLSTGAIWNDAGTLKIIT